ncbi:hypothetical protein F2Q68_00010053 [Brassica cretica]|uniref:Uncharacterized protein n=1 Tax=Brassica cretica TaxID=69181 RepID=A0A8S9KQU0_BRACR|nr:hypothetical protein F2Q68_00010053 [Brassica cretica]
MVKPKRAKIAHASTENASEKDDPESSTQATDKEQPVSKPNASTQPEETNPLVKTDELDRPRDSARPFAEWDKSSSANGRAGSTTDSAWPFAELD